MAARKKAEPKPDYSVEVTASGQGFAWKALDPDGGEIASGAHADEELCRMTGERVLEDYRSHLTAS